MSPEAVCWFHHGSTNISAQCLSVAISCGVGMQIPPQDPKILASVSIFIRFCWGCPRGMPGVEIETIGFDGDHIHMLWFYRELQERKTGVHALRVNRRGEPFSKKHVRRFSRHWRQVHLVLALAVMTLALTGTTLLYADSFWAPTMMKMLGGPKVAGIIHRSAAFIFGLLFFGHIAVVLGKNLVKRLEGFRWFGPDSLLPRWQDFHDFAAMMRWFFGKGPTSGV